MTNSEGNVPQKQLYKEPFIKFNTTPTKLSYNVGDSFETAGFSVSYIDIYGNSTNITDKIKLYVNSVNIYNGYRFTQSGTKIVNCYYNGKKENYFQIKVN